MLDLLGTKETGGDATVAELVFDLAHLDDEVLPLLVIVAEQTALLVFLGDGDIGGAIGVFPAFEIAEIALRQELLVPVVLSLEFLLGEYILLVDGVTFAQGAHQ